jgi:hypothetical protein
VEQEGGEEADGADAEAGEGDEGHSEAVYSSQFVVHSWRFAGDESLAKRLREFF